MKYTAINLVQTFNRKNEMFQSLPDYTWSSYSGFGATNCSWLYISRFIVPEDKNDIKHWLTNKNMFHLHFLNSSTNVWKVACHIKQFFLYKLSFYLACLRKNDFTSPKFLTRIHQKLEVFLIYRRALPQNGQVQLFFAALSQVKVVHLRKLRQVGLPHYDL